MKNWLKGLFVKQDEAKIDVVADLGGGQFEVAFNGKRSVPATIVVTSPRSIALSGL